MTARSSDFSTGHRHRHRVAVLGDFRQVEPDATFGRRLAVGEFLINSSESFLAASARGAIPAHAAATTPTPTANAARRSKPGDISALLDSSSASCAELTWDRTRMEDCDIGRRSAGRSAQPGYAYIFRLLQLSRRARRPMQGLWAGTAICRPGAPLPTFASHCSTLQCERRSRRTLASLWCQCGFVP